MNENGGASAPSTPEVYAMIPSSTEALQPPLNSVLVGDVLEMLRTFPDECVDCCVTSPPYWGLRDYGHEGQIGLEKTPQEFVAKMVEVFREVRRVLKSAGTCWVNLGDSYANDGKWGGSSGGKHVEALHGNSGIGRQKVTTGLKPKDLCMIPHRVAIALQDDGWWVRQDIVWHKPNPMPESVRDRCTKSHEYVFLLTKGERYFYDADAVKEAQAPSSVARLAQDVDSQAGSDRVPGKTNGNMKAVGGRPQMRRALELAKGHGLTDAHISAIRAGGITDTGKATVTQDGTGKNTAEVQRLMAEAKAALGGYYREFLIPDTRNRRSVWTIPTQGYPGAHFATFPEELPRTCILAGCPEGGVVLDPFAGSGTTLAVALKLGRKYLGIELNPEYARLIDRRLSVVTPPLDLFAEAA